MNKNGLIEGIAAKVLAFKAGAALKAAVNGG